MTSYEQLTVSLRELRESQAQTDKQMKETDEKMQKTDEQMKRTDEKMQENRDQMKQMMASIEKVSQNINGVNKSIGLETEEFFFSSMTKNPTLAHTNFDYVYKNDTRNLKGKTQEIDILLENGNSIGIVEVKNKITQKSIDQLDKIVDNFYYFHREYEGYKLIGALAGKIFPKHLQIQALKKGYSVLTQQGDHVELIDP